MIDIAPDPPTNTSNKVKVKRYPIKRTTITTPKQSLITKLHTEQPALKMIEIAAIAKTSHSYVIETLQRFGLRHKSLQDYQSNRADIWDSVTMAMLGSLTTDDIKKIPGAARIMSAGLAYDKMRIERGLSDGTAKPLVQIQINTVHNPVDNTTLLTNPLLHNVTPTIQAIDITTNMDTMSDNV